LNYRDECASKFLNALFNGEEITRDNFEIDGQGDLSKCTAIANYLIQVKGSRPVRVTKWFPNLLEIQFVRACEGKVTTTSSRKGRKGNSPYGK